MIILVALLCLRFFSFQLDPGCIIPPREPSAHSARFSCTHNPDANCSAFQWTLITRAQPEIELISPGVQIYGPSPHFCTTFNLNFKLNAAVRSHKPIISNGLPSQPRAGHLDILLDPFDGYSCGPRHFQKAFMPPPAWWWWLAKPSEMATAKWHSSRETYCDCSPCSALSWSHLRRDRMFSPSSRMAGSPYSVSFSHWKITWDSISYKLY